MKNILIILLLFLPVILFGQEKDVMKALSGYPKDYLYEVKYTDKNAITGKKFNEWYSKNQNKYILMGIDIENCFIRGTTRPCVKGFLFFKKEDLSKYKVLLDERKKEQEKIAASRISIWDIVKGVVVAYTTYKIVEKSVDFFSSDEDSGDSYNTDSGSLSSSFKYSVGDKVYIDFPWKTTSGDGFIGALFTNKYTLRMYFEVKISARKDNKNAYRLYAYAAEFGYSGTWVSYNEIKGKNKAEEKAMAEASKYLYKEHDVFESNITGKK
jgi:hypothetical protein